MIRLDYGFSSAMAWVYLCVIVIIAVFSAITQGGCIIMNKRIKEK